MFVTDRRGPATSGAPSPTPPRRTDVLGYHAQTGVIDGLRAQVAWQRAEIAVLAIRLTLCVVGGLPNPSWDIAPMPSGMRATSDSPP